MRHFLLIDDDEIFNFIHSHVISHVNQDAKITVFQSANLALDFLKDNPGDQPDLIFLDVNMPGMNGFEFLEQYDLIENTKNDLPKVYMVTSSLDKRDHDRANAFNQVAGFIDKPLTIEFIKSIQ